MTQQVMFLDPAEVLEKIKDGSAYVIDVREPHEYAEAHIAGVALMPLSQFDPSAVSPPEDKTLIFHCRSGRRCGMAAERLVDAGYTGKIYRLAGGLLAWTADGLPLETGASN
ncbi:MAG: rhodanese-like domain-containing protein [Alphaproteobacteria bacterium]|nr:rhodanese-like domain-containing protein [Alphaproteobacteria bacterium]